MVEEVFQNLVDQFSDPFTCLRELIQNAMDAGTQSIEVQTRYLPEPGGVCLEIRDFGEGMNRDIIESKLTRLFSSDKENDLTKIGKFGIGFVSVFSLKPELVLVDTGRDGEFWRIAFDGGTDFQLFTLHEPLEGTSVRLYRLLPYENYDSFVERCRSTIGLWCRHSATSICFNGEEINEDLVVDSVCRVNSQSALGRFNVGVHPSTSAPFGLYNTGLTLTEGEQEHLPGVSYKILSNHLEHTLTRDAVIHDDGFKKVMERLNDLVDNALFDQVLKNFHSQDLREETAAQARVYLQYMKPRLSKVQKRQAVLEDLLGHKISWADLEKCAKKEDRLFATTKVSRLAERAGREGLPVLPFSPNSQMALLFSSLFEAPVVGLEENLAVSQPVPRPPGFPGLEAQLKSLLRKGRIHVTSVVPVEYPDSVRDPNALPCVFSLGSDRLVRRYRKGFWGTRYVLPQHLLLDVDHPLVRKAFSRLETPTGLRVAAYALCKSALLDDGLDPKTENRLLETLTTQS